MRWLLVPVLFVVAQLTVPEPDSAAGADPFIECQRRGDGWCFVQGDRPFFSWGVTTVIPVDWPPKERPDRGHYDGLQAHQGNEAMWAKAVADRLASWGFNTLGAWADTSIQQQPSLYFTQMASFGGWSGNRLIDVFSQPFADAIDEVGRREIAPLAHEPRLLGWFTNNELNWHGEHGWPEDPNQSLLEKYLALASESAGRTRLLAWLREYFGGDFSRFRDAFDTTASDWAGLEQVRTLKPHRFRLAQRTKYAWAGEVAERYFSLSEAAIRRHDPKHLILGCRFAGSAMTPVAQAQARHCDVLSINVYSKEGSAPIEMLDRLYALTGKPIMITEFSWRAMENRSGCANSRGADVTVPTQHDRAQRADRFVRAVMARPYLLGLHWFQHHDEPANGRFDGEDSNYGLVDHHDRPYEELTGVFTRLSSELQPGSWKRDPFPASDRQGPAEYDPLALASGTFTSVVNVQPPADARDRVWPSGDDAHGAKLTLEPEGDGGWRIPFETGTGWGIAPMFATAPHTSLAGAKRFRVRLQAPRGASWRVLLVETGHDRADFSGQGGADGETFTSETLAASGDVEERTFWLEDFLLRWEYGNQHGNRRLDLDGLAGVHIAISDQNLRGTLRVLALEFLPAP
jgi:hypothetical protein